MILFYTSDLKMSNYVIHHFLEIELENTKENDEDIGDLLEGFVPTYLFREQYRKCCKVFNDLIEWTNDDFLHSMTAFHETILFYFLNYLSEYHKDIGSKNFKKIYFDKQARSLIAEAYKEYSTEPGSMTIKEWKALHYDPFYIADLLFEETDFLMIDTLYNYHKLGSTFLEDHLGINLDFYFELLPLDIQDQYKTSHITLTGEVSAMLRYINHRMHHCSLYKLFWDGDIPAKEDKIQLILENIMDAYFYKQEIEIIREAMLGNGKVDFKLYKNHHEDEKILIEIKRAHSSYLKKGYENQLTNYIASSGYKNAFYLIVCFTDAEYTKALRFIGENVYTDTFQLYINISILDASKRKTASNI